MSLISALDCEVELAMDDNEEVFKREILLADAIIMRNRHRSVEPYEWFGPDPEPNSAGMSCTCQGCWVRFVTSEAGFQLAPWQSWYIQHATCGGKWTTLIGRKGPKVVCSCKDDRKN